MAGNTAGGRGSVGSKPATGRPRLALRERGDFPDDGSGGGNAGAVADGRIAADRTHIRRGLLVSERRRPGDEVEARCVAEIDSQSKVWAETSAHGGDQLHKPL